MAAALYDTQMMELSDFSSVDVAMQSEVAEPWFHSEEMDDTTEDQYQNLEHTSTSVEIDMEAPVEDVEYDMEDETSTSQYDQDVDVEFASPRPPEQYGEHEHHVEETAVSAPAFMFSTPHTEDEPRMEAADLRTKSAAQVQEAIDLPHPEWRDLSTAEEQPEGSAPSPAGEASAAVEPETAQVVDGAAHTTDSHELPEEDAPEAEVHHHEEQLEPETHDGQYAPAFEALDALENVGSGETTAGEGDEAQYDEDEPIEIPSVLLSMPQPEPSFCLFSQPTPSSAGQQVWTLLLHDQPSLYFATIDKVFDALRADEQLTTAAAEYMDGEYILDAYDLQLAINEDNKYLDRFSIHGLQNLHDECGFTGPLRLQLQIVAPRLIDRHQQLLDQVERTNVALLDAEQQDTHTELHEDHTDEAVGIEEHVDSNEAEVEADQAEDDVYHHDPTAHHHPEEHPIDIREHEDHTDLSSHAEQEEDEDDFSAFTAHDPLIDGEIETGDEVYTELSTPALRALSAFEDGVIPEEEEAPGNQDEVEAGEVDDQLAGDEHGELEEEEPVEGPEEHGELATETEEVQHAGDLTLEENETRYDALGFAEPSNANAVASTSTSSSEHEDYSLLGNKEFEDEQLSTWDDEEEHLDSTGSAHAEDEFVGYDDLTTADPESAPASTSALAIPSTPHDACEPHESGEAFNNPADVHWDDEQDAVSNESLATLSSTSTSLKRSREDDESENKFVDVVSGEPHLESPNSKRLRTL